MKKRILITMLALLLVATFGVQSIAFAQEAEMGAKVQEQEVNAPVANEAGEAEITLQAAVPGRISGLKAVSVSSSSIKITWKKATNAYKYLIYRSTTKSGGYKLIRKQRGASYTNTGLSAGKKYYYKVIPYTKSNGKGKTAGPVAAVTKSALDGGWIATKMDDIYRHMYVFKGSKVSFYRVDAYGGDSWIGREWGTYPVVANSGGTFDMRFDGYSRRVKYIDSKTIEITDEDGVKERFSRLSNTELSALLATL